MNGYVPNMLTDRAFIEKSQPQFFAIELIDQLSNFSLEYPIVDTAISITDGVKLWVCNKWVGARRVIPGGEGEDGQEAYEVPDSGGNVCGGSEKDTPFRMSGAFFGHPEFHWSILGEYCKQFLFGSLLAKGKRTGLKCCEAVVGQKLSVK